MKLKLAKLLVKLKRKPNLLSKEKKKKTFTIPMEMHDLDFLMHCIMNSNSGPAFSYSQFPVIS